MKVEFKSAAVIGAARSGIAVSKLLASKGYEVFLSDAGNIQENVINEFKKMNIKYETGRHSDEIFNKDIIILSPGVPQNSEVVNKAVKNNKPVYSEIEVASWFCPGKIISITGTNGKTTTTTLIGKLFKDSGFRAFVCGNIGVAFSDIIPSMNSESIAVVETSSFQLDNIKYFKPDTALILNITPDHLDRYGHSFNNYIKSKMKITQNQDQNDCLIYNYDDEILRHKVVEIAKTKIIPFSTKIDLSMKFAQSAFLKNDDLVYFYNDNMQKIIKKNELKVKGEHNVYNVLASVLAAKAYNISNDNIRNTLITFQGVEHRLEFVRELDGIKFYNDSKATNVNSVWYALQGFDSPIVLILGGRDKGNDYSLIEKEVKKNVKHIIALGESKDKVYDYFKDIVPVTKSDDLNQAVRLAVKNSGKNDIVLLSPACASFDMFENYEDRGKQFKNLVNAL